MHWMDDLGQRVGIGGDTVELIAWMAVLFLSFGFIGYVML